MTIEQILPARRAEPRTGSLLAYGLLGLPLATAALPILYLARSGDGDEVPFETAAAADVTWARFEGACHETFTSTPLPCDFDKEEGLDDVAAYLTAFAAERVLGLEDQEYADILDGTTTVDDRITVQRTQRASASD